MTSLKDAPNHFNQLLSMATKSDLDVLILTFRKHAGLTGTNAEVLRQIITGDFDLPLFYADSAFSPLAKAAIAYRKSLFLDSINKGIIRLSRIHLK